MTPFIVKIGTLTPFPIFLTPFSRTFAVNPGTSEFEKWKYREFTVAELGDSLVSGDLADPEADDLGTLLEFALGGSPKLPDTGRLTTVGLTEVSGTDHLDFTYLRRTAPSGITYLPEFSEGSMIDLDDSWIGCLKFGRHHGSACQIASNGHHAHVVRKSGTVPKEATSERIPCPKEFQKLPLLSSSLEKYRSRIGISCLS